MRTIKPITEHEITLLKAEPQALFEPHCVWSGPDIVLPQRIVDRIYVDGTCWRVKGWNSKNGFANIKVGGKTRKVHRITYTLIRGPIPEGHVADHIKEACKHRDCCHPWHLEPVTVKVNTERGGSVPYAPKEKAPPQLSDEA